MWVEGRAVALVRRRGGEPGAAASPRLVQPMLQPHRPHRIPLGDGNGQVGAPQPGSGRPGWEATEVLGNRERLARVAVHAVPPHLARDRRGTGGGGPPAGLSPFANTGRDSHDTVGVRARRPPTTTTPGPPLCPPSPTRHGRQYPWTRCCWPRASGDISPRDRTRPARPSVGACVVACHGGPCGPLPPARMGLPLWPGHPKGGTRVGCGTGSW